MIEVGHRGRRRLGVFSEGPDADSFVEAPPRRDAVALEPPAQPCGGSLFSSISVFFSPGVTDFEAETATKSSSP